MTAPKYATRRARVHLEVYGSGVLEDVFNVEASAMGFSEDMLDKFSTSENMGVIARTPLRTQGTLDMALGSIDFDTMLRSLRAKESAQAAVVDGTFTVPVLKAGQAFKLPSAKVTACAVPGKTENLDYVLFKSSGVVKFLADVIEPITGGTYSAGTARVAGLAAAAVATYTVHITDELTGTYTCFFKFQPNLPDSISLVSPDEWGNYPLNGVLLIDETRPASGDLGQFGFSVGE